MGIEDRIEDLERLTDYLENRLRQLDKQISDLPYFLVGIRQPSGSPTEFIYLQSFTDHQELLSCVAKATARKRCKNKFKKGSILYGFDAYTIRRYYAPEFMRHS